MGQARYSRESFDSNEGTLRPRWVVVTEIASVAAFALLLLPVSAKLGLDVWRTGNWWTVGPGLLLAYLAADLVSGTVHWIGDSFYEETTPVLGPLLIRTFREHHRDPESITRHGFFEVNGCNCLGLVLPLIAIWLADTSELPGDSWLFVRAFVIAFVLAIFGTNQFHKWAHSSKSPRLVKGLQRAGLILSPEHHQRHHSGRHDRSFCITSGWMNHLMDRAGLFRRAERSIRSISRTLR